MDAATQCRFSFYRFFQEFWDVIEPEALVENWHIKYLCNELQDVAERVFDREKKAYDLLINVPPGETKSTIVTKMFPAWCWTRDPTIRTINTSYAEAVARHHAVMSRDILRSDKYRQMFGEVQIKPDEDTKTYYKNTAGGDRLATSTGGSVLGMHAHFLLIDDPLNPKKAVSDAERSAANDYIRHTLNTRKVDKEVSVTVMIMQRLHAEDPSSILLGRENVKHLCLPGELSGDVSPADVREYYTDGVMDPLRLGQEVLRQMEAELGSYGYAGQIQQRPSPEGGGKWQQWFLPVPDAEMPRPQELSQFGTDWDTAFTSKEENSASAYIVSGKKDEKMYIHDLGWVWKEFPDLMKEMQQHPEPHYIESKASGKSAKQTLVNAGIAAIEVPIEGGSDKIARANNATPKAEAGLVYVRESLLETLYHDPQQGILQFPRGPHDDLADVLTQAIQRHYRKRVTRQPRIIMT